MYLTDTMFVDGQATVGFILDITDRKRAEDNLKEERGTLFEADRHHPGLRGHDRPDGRLPVVNQQS